MTNSQQTCFSRLNCLTCHARQRHLTTEVSRFLDWRELPPCLTSPTDSGQDWVMTWTRLLCHRVTSIAP